MKKKFGDQNFNRRKVKNTFKKDVSPKFILILIYH